MVADGHPRCGVEIDVAVDATKVPHVLALDITAVAPAIDAHGELIFSLAEKAGEVELGVGIGALRVADVAPVDPHHASGVEAVEMEEDALVAPVGGQREGATVEARSIVVLDARLGMALLGQGWMIDEGIAHVGIDGIAIARHLPRQGNADLVPALGVARLGDEGIGVGRTLGRAGDIAKLPHTVERQVAAALRGGPGLGVEGHVLAHRLGGSVGDIGGMGCLLVIADLLGIADPGDVEARRLVLRIAVGHGGDGGLPAEEGQEGRRDHAVVRIGLTHIGLCLMIVFEKDHFMDDQGARWSSAKPPGGQGQEP